MNKHQADGQAYDKNGNPSNSYTRDDAREQERQAGLDADRKEHLANQSQVARGRQHDEYAHAREQQRIREVEASRKQTYAAREEQGQERSQSETQSQSRSKSKCL